MAGINKLLSINHSAAVSVRMLLEATLHTRWPNVHFKGGFKKFVICYVMDSLQVQMIPMVTQFHGETCSKHP